MAIYHLSAQPLARSANRSAIAAAAYRSGTKIVDHQTGVVHDYSPRQKKSVLHAELILPGGQRVARDEFWNSLELHHKRKDAVLAREVEVSLPHELNAEQRKELALAFALQLSIAYGVAADVALHAPNRITDADLKRNPQQFFVTESDGRKHNGNWHAHILLSACHVDSDGSLGKKAVALDPIHCQRHKLPNVVDIERARWAQLANAALEKAASSSRIDHRSHLAREINKLPSTHLGVNAAAVERKTGQKSRRRIAHEEEMASLRRLAREIGQSQERIAVLEADLASVPTPVIAPENPPVLWEDLEIPELEKHQAQLKKEGAQAAADSLIGVEEQAARVQEQQLKTRHASALQAEKAAHQAVEQWREKHPVKLKLGFTQALTALQAQEQECLLTSENALTALEQAQERVAELKKRREQDARAPFEYTLSAIDAAIRQKQEAYHEAFRARLKPLIAAQRRLDLTLSDPEAFRLAYAAVEAGDERLEVLDAEIARFARDGVLVAVVEERPEIEEPATDLEIDTPSEDDDLSPGW